MANLQTYVLFRVGETLYGVPSDTVQQMEMIEQITRVPNAPPFVDGIVYLRGKVIPVINLRVRFGLERIPYTLQSRLIVVELNDRWVGLAVDSAREFVHLDTDQIQPPPEAIVASGNPYIVGITRHQDRVVLILNLKEVLAPKEKAQLSQEAMSGISQ